MIPSNHLLLALLKGAHSGIGLIQLSFEQGQLQLHRQVQSTAAAVVAVAVAVAVTLLGSFRSSFSSLVLLAVLAWP